MAGVKGRSGRKPRQIETYADDNYYLTKVILHRYLTKLNVLSGDELASNPRAVEQVLSVYLRERDIDSKKQVALINAAPLMALLTRAESRNTAIDNTPAKVLYQQISDAIGSTDHDAPIDITPPPPQPDITTTDPIAQP